MDAAIGCVALLLGAALTWASYELYHQMRLFEAFTGPWLGFGVLSLLSAFVGGSVIKAAAQ